MVQIAVERNRALVRAGRAKVFIATASTALVVAAIVLLVPLAPGWERVQKAFFNGEVFKGGRAERVVTAASFDPPQGGNLAGAFIGRFTAPAIFEGTTQLVHEPIDQVADQRSAWVYNSGQRRVLAVPPGEGLFDVSKRNVHRWIFLPRPHGLTTSASRSRRRRGSR